MALGQGEVAWVGGGRVRAGVRREAAELVSSVHGEVTEAIFSTEDGHPYMSSVGEVLWAKLGEAPGAFAVEVSQGLGAQEGDSAGIVVEAAVGDDWRAVTRIQPGIRSRLIVVDSVGTSEVRLVCRGEYAVHGLYGIAEPYDATVQAASVREARLSGSGAIEPARFDRGGDGVVLASGETLTLGWDLEKENVAPAHAWLLEVTGARGGRASRTAMQGTATAPPATFALGQSRPNPATGGALIPFELPRRAHVRIEVFDLSGRRVRTLCDAPFAAGYHAVAWGNGAERLRPGVYFYRMHANDFVSERKIVVVP